MANSEAGRNAASRARDAMRRHEVLASGMLAGILGGIAMMAVAMIAAVGQGIAAVHPLEVLGETFVGPEALDGVAAKVAFGALVHAVTSAAFGIVFAAVVPRDLPTGCAMGLGVGFALLAMGFMTSLVVPWANPGFRGGIQVIGGSWVIALGVFGATLGVAPALRRRLSREASDASANGAERMGPRPGAVAPTTRAT